MQRKNSALTSLCLAKQTDEVHSSKNVQRCGSNSLHRKTELPSYVATMKTAIYEQLAACRFDSACNKLNLTDKYPNGTFHYSQPQTAYTGKAKLHRLPNTGQLDFATLIPSGSQTTRSEPATRSNSIDCEKDILKLPTISTVSHDMESPVLSNLIVPNGE